MKKIIFSALLLAGIFARAQEFTDVSFEVHMNDMITSDSQPNNFMKLGNKMVFEGYDGVNVKLYSHENGLYNSVNLTIDSIKIRDFKVLIPKNDNELYFMGHTHEDNSNNRVQNIFVTGLTNETTKWLATANEPAQFTVVNEKLYYTNKGLYVNNAITIAYTDGTVEGTGNLDLPFPLSNIDNLKVYNNQLYFNAKRNSTSQIFKLTDDHEVIQLTNFSTENFTIYDYIFKDEQQSVLHILGNTISNQVVVSDCIDGNCTTIATLDNQTNRLDTKNKSILKLDNNIYYVLTERDTSMSDFNFFRINAGSLVALDFVQQGYHYKSRASRVFEPFKFRGDWYVPVNGFDSFYKIKNNKVYLIVTGSGSNLYERSLIVTPTHFYFTNDQNVYKSDGTFTEEAEFLTSFSSRSMTDVYKGKRNLIGFDGINIFYQSPENPKGREPWIYNIQTGENRLFDDINIKGDIGINRLKGFSDYIMAMRGESAVFRMSIPDYRITYSPVPDEIFSSYTSYSVKYKNKNGANYLIAENDVNRSSHRIYKENLATNTFDIFYKNQRYYQDHGFLEADIYDDYLYFKGENPQAVGKYKLNYNPLNSTEKITVNNLPNEQDYTLTNGFQGLFELNGSYYFAASGNNNGTIMRTSLGSNSAAIAYQFVQGNDTKQARIIGKIDNQLIVNYNQSLYKYNGSSMSRYNEGNNFDYHSLNEITGINQPIYNDKFLVYKNTPLTSIYEVWFVNDTESINLDLYTTSTKIRHFIKCNNKAYFVMDNNILYETDGTISGTYPIESLDHRNTEWHKPVKCYNDNLIFVGNVNKRSIGVINSEGRRDYRVDGTYKTLIKNLTNPNILDFDVTNDKIYLLMSSEQTGSRFFIGDASLLNLSTLSVSDTDSDNLIQTQKKLKIYPNPVANDLFVKLNNNEIVNNVEIVDMNGNRQFNPYYSTDKNVIKVQTNQLLQGLYFIKVTTNQSIYSNQFIKK